MHSPLVAAICLLCLHDHFFVGATEMTLQEGAAVYNTSIEYDPLTADVITYVPYHQRDGMEFHESTKIENIYLGISVWRESGDKNFCGICRGVVSIPSSVFPNLKAKISYCFKIYQLPP